jgi:hypothetical protein
VNDTEFFFGPFGVVTHKAMPNLKNITGDE